MVEYMEMKRNASIITCNGIWHRQLLAAQLHTLLIIRLNTLEIQGNTNFILFNTSLFYIAND